ncbi:membrane protein [Candidatus Paracaedimonas acanthamoebae]|nr:membrane protein [Candidatus Paracaedimonas acanthamoebae]
MSIQDKVYVTLCTLFSVVIVTGNLVYQKFVSLPLLPFHTFELSAGAILYPFTFLLTDLITEFQGKERANFCVSLGIGMNIIVVFLITIIDYLSATSWSKVDSITFHNVFGMFGVSFLGSIIACYTAQKIDIIIYTWIREKTKGQFLWVRSIGSTAISLFIDTSIVNIFLSVNGILPFERLGWIIFNSYLYKLFFTVWSIPLFYISVNTIKRLTRVPLKI